MAGHDPNEAREVRTKEQLVRMRTERREQQVADDLAMVMSTIGGRRFISGVLGQLCEVRSSAFRAGHADQSRMQDYLLGRQSIGLQLLEQFEQHTPDQLQLMTTETKWAEAALKADLAAEDAMFDENGEPIEQETTDG